MVHLNVILYTMIPKKANDYVHESQKLVSTYSQWVHRHHAVREGHKQTSPVRRDAGQTIVQVEGWQQGKVLKTYDWKIDVWFWVEDVHMLHTSIMPYFAMNT